MQAIPLPLDWGFRRSAPPPAPTVLQVHPIVTVPLFCALGTSVRGRRRALRGLQVQASEETRHACELGPPCRIHLHHPLPYMLDALAKRILKNRSTGRGAPQAVSRPWAADDASALTNSDHEDLTPSGYPPAAFNCLQSACVSDGCPAAQPEGLGAWWRTATATTMQT